MDQIILIPTINEIESENKVCNELQYEDITLNMIESFQCSATERLNEIKLCGTIIQLVSNSPDEVIQNHNYSFENGLMGL